MAEQRAEDQQESGEAEVRTDDPDAEGPAELSGSTIVQQSLEELLSRHSSLPGELVELLQKLHSKYRRPDDGATAHGAAAAEDNEEEVARARESIVKELYHFVEDLAADNSRLRQENADLERKNELLRASRGDDVLSHVSSAECEGIVLPPLELPEEAELQLQCLSSLGPLSMHQNWGH